MNRALRFACLLVFGLIASSAHAQLNTALPDISHGPDDSIVSTRDNLVRQPSWQDGRPRYFVAGSFDLGFLYVRPRFSFGWGRPHNKWLGADLNPTVSQNIVGGYAGVRFDHPHVNLRMGARYGFPFARTYLAEISDEDSYNSRDLEGESEELGAGAYTTLEAELTTGVALGDGAVFAEFAVSYILGIPDGFNVYEDTIRIIAAPGWTWRGRVGYEARFGREGAVRVGVVGEFVGNPGRDLLVFRAGLTLRIWASPRLEIRGAWIPAIGARDRIGIAGGNFGLLGVRYRWATGGITGDG